MPWPIRSGATFLELDSCNDRAVATGDTRAEPFRAELDGAALADLARRLDMARLPARHDSTWERGVPGSWLAGLIADWRAFDPLRLQARLDQLTHLRAEVGGIAVHLVYAAGSGPDPLPLLLTHGWPSSFLEYLDLLPLLTDPGGHGGQAADAFTVVAPSLPGFGFSGLPPAGGLTHEQVAELWYQIMTGILGYRRFAAHGSDLGAGGHRPARPRPSGGGRRDPPRDPGPAGTAAAMERTGERAFPGGRRMDRRRGRIRPHARH